jgi:hypothetical protein
LRQFSLEQRCGWSAGCFSGLGGFHDVDDISARHSKYPGHSLARLFLRHDGSKEERKLCMSRRGMRDAGAGEGASSSKSSSSAGGRVRYHAQVQTTTISGAALVHLIPHAARWRRNFAEETDHECSFAEDGRSR